MILDPGEGDLACGDSGVGRMAEPEEIMEVIERSLEQAADLSGREILVTAGPTREYIDDVRFLSNPSTGRMGFLVADRAAKRGARVTLVSGPTGLPCPQGVELLRIVSAQEMKEAVVDNIPGKDALIMAAAVADFRPESRAGGKIKKRDRVPELRLERTEDILGGVFSGGAGCVVVGFAAEAENVVENARRKMTEKNMDFIVANKVGVSDSGFEVDTNLASIMAPQDDEVELEMLTKVELADLILDRIVSILEES